MYRSQAADEAHQSILAYVRSGGKVTRVTQAITALDKKSILETSLNGHSHLIDILHLPFVIKTTKAPDKKSIVLFDLLYKKAESLGADVLVSLLTQPDITNITPLHQAANSGSMDLFTAVLNGMKNTLTPDAYQTAIRYKTDRGRMPSCDRKKAQAEQINQLLWEERHKANSQSHTQMARTRGRTTELTAVAASSSGFNEYSKRQRVITKCDKRKSLFVFFTCQDNHRSSAPCSDRHLNTASGPQGESTLRIN